MPVYEVECWVECRTVYAIEAENEGEARALAEDPNHDHGDELIVEIGCVDSTGQITEGC